MGLLIKDTRRVLAGRMGMPPRADYTGARAEAITDAGRITATRIVTLGVFAIAAKKGQSVVMVTCADGSQHVSSKMYKAKEAVELAARFNSAKS